MECDCFVSQDGSRIVLKTPGEFAKDMLSTPMNLPKLASAFTLSGIGSPGARLEITVGAKPKVKNALDELADAEY